MVGCIIAGGLGTRLYPITRFVAKSLLPLGGEPMIYHPIKKLVGVGITDILIITGPDQIGPMAGALGSGEEFGARLEYKVQDEPKGIAQALSLAQRFAGKDSICVILGDNVFEDDLDSLVNTFKIRGEGCTVALKEVDDPKRFGVAEVDSKTNKLIRIEEKPKKPKSNLAVTGIYVYDRTVFDRIKKLQPSYRNELEITDLNNTYAEERLLTYTLLKGYYADCGTHESYREANRLVNETPPK